MKETWTFSADGAYQTDVADLSGRSYAEIIRSYDPFGRLQTSLFANNDGAHTLKGHEDGLTLTATKNEETFVGGGNEETFTFGSPFGHDILGDTLVLAPARHAVAPWRAVRRQFRRASRRDRLHGFGRHDHGRRQRHDRD